jgi:ferredoxin
MEKTTDIGIRPKSFEGHCGTCVTSCLSEAEQLLNKFSTVGVYRNYESLIFSSLDATVAALGHISNVVPPTHHSVSFNVFHVSPLFKFVELFDPQDQRVRSEHGGYWQAPWCRFFRSEYDPGNDLLVSKTRVFSTYDRYDLGIHCGDLTVQDSGSQFDVRTRDWGQDGIRGSRSPIDHNIFYLLLKTTCENKGFSANTSNHPHVVSTPSMYGSLTDRNSYIQKEKISANLSRKAFMYQVGTISKWVTCGGCSAGHDPFGLSMCPTQAEKYTLGSEPVYLNTVGRGNEVFDTEQEAVDAVKLTPPKIFAGQVITPPQPRKQLSKSYGSSFGIYPTNCGGAAYCRSPDHLAIGCKSQLQTWGWVDGGSYYEQVSTRQSWSAGCTGPVGEFGDQPDPTLFRCGQRKWQPYGYIAPSSPLPPIVNPGYTPPPPYLGCRSQKGHILSANGLVDTNLNQFTLSTPNDLLDLSSCDVSMASLLLSGRQSTGQDLVGMAFYSAPISGAATANSFDFNFQEIYKREFSWKNLNPTMEPFNVDITASM